MMKIDDFIKQAIMKKFPTRAKGYDPEEVDKYFDTLIDKIKELSHQNDEVKLKNDEYMNEINNLKMKNEKILLDNDKLNNQVEELLKSGYHNEAVNRRLKKLEEQIEVKKNDK